MPTRLHGDPRTCPVTHQGRACGTVVREGQLMCPGHWRLVPPDVKRTVWASWRRWQRDMTDDHWQAYLTARTTALEAIAR